MTVCKQQAPDMKSMTMHFESKHPKETMDHTKFVDKHEVYGGTTQGVAVKGTQRKEKKGKDWFLFFKLRIIVKRFEVARLCSRLDDDGDRE